MHRAIRAAAESDLELSQVGIGKVARTRNKKDGLSPLNEEYLVPDAAAPNCTQLLKEHHS